VSLIPGFLAVVVVSGLGSLKSIYSLWVEFRHFLKVINPMGAQCSGVPDKLAPYRPAQPVLQCDILNRIQRDHRIGILLGSTAKETLICEPRGRIRFRSYVAFT
jgi:hypothetical protein